MKVSVVIPTLNGGEILGEVLEAIEAQEYERGEVEVVAIDSGSTDGTRERLEGRGVQLTTIAREEFDHGATRDLGISKASGEVVVLLVQDAVPANHRWLEGLVREFDDPVVAATCCRQLPREDAFPYDALELGRSFVGGTEPRCGRLEPGEELESLTPWERMERCTLDNVCSALRRSVWEELPFGRCAFGEDSRWARRAILTGHAITYTAAAQVVHSHRRSILYEYRRTYLSHYLLYELFGLRTVPDYRTAWRSLLSAGEWIRACLQSDASWSQRLAEALRAPVERYLTALAQYRGARDAALGLPAKRFSKI